MKFFLSALSNKNYTSFKEGNKNMSDSDSRKLTCTPIGCSKDDIEDNTSFSMPDLKSDKSIVAFFLLIGSTCICLMIINLGIIPGILSFFGAYAKTLNNPELISSSQGKSG
jgi:hypothetical protein